MKGHEYLYIAEKGYGCQALNLDAVTHCGLDYESEVHGMARPESRAGEALNAAFALPKKPPERRLQLVVWHFGRHNAAYYPIPQSGWRIDCDTRHLILGKGVPRKMIPLDGVMSYDIEEIS